MKEVNKKQHSIHPLFIWLIASILFHILLILMSIVLRINQHDSMKHLHEKFPRQQQTALLMLDQHPKIPPQPAPLKPQQPQPTATSQPKSSDYILIPGRKGVDLQNIVPEEASAQPSKPTTQPQQPAANEKQTTTDTQPKTPELEKFKSKHVGLHTDKTVPEKQDIKQSVSPTQKSSTMQQKSTQKQDPYQYVPKQTRSFKDLNLGFNHQAANVGNTQYLLQMGTITAAPDAESLKHLTYVNQMATTIVQAIRAHPRFSSQLYRPGTMFSLTIDRQGKVLNVAIIISSGNQIFDTIILEALQSTGLYPAVPAFIPDNPYSQNWRLV